MDTYKLIQVALTSLLGAVAGNLAHFLFRTYRQRQQMLGGGLADGDVVRAVWVPQSTVVATVLASRVAHRPGAVGFLLAMAVTLVAAAAAD